MAQLPWSHRGATHMVSDPAVKIHQYYSNISKAFGLFRKSYIGVYGPDIEILVSEFATYESVRILISVPKKNQITKVNKPNLLKYIRKNCPMLVDPIETSS